MEATHRFRPTFDRSFNHIGKRQVVGYAPQGMLLVSTYTVGPELSACYPTLASLSVHISMKSTTDSSRKQATYHAKSRHLFQYKPGQALDARFRP
jgi:hypothetical protein